MATYNMLANVWENNFLFFNDDYKYNYTYSELEQCFSDLEHAAKLYNIHPTSIFNSYAYHTYFGNFAHGSAYKIINLLKDGSINLTFPYLYILFVVRYKYNVNLHHKDYYNESPLEYCKSYYDPKTPLVNPHLYSNSCFHILLKLVDPSFCIVSKAQSFVRKWLAKRTLVRMKMNVVFTHLLTAPPKSIEFYTFPYFPGGTMYLNAYNDFNNGCIEELMTLLC